MTKHDLLRAAYDRLAVADTVLGSGSMLPSDRSTWQSERRNAYRDIKRLEARGASIAR